MMKIITYYYNLELIITNYLIIVKKIMKIFYGNEDSYISFKKLVHYSEQFATCPLSGLGSHTVEACKH
jgi:hypothetical protein